MTGIAAHSKTESWLTLTGQTAHLGADYSINAQSEAAFFDGVQFTVEIEGEIAQEDVEIIWMTIGGNTEYVEGNDRIIAEIKISDNDELICDTKINFAKKAIDAIEDVLERNGM